MMEMMTRVLIVEDVAALRQQAAAITKAIAPGAIEVVEASNGAEGLSLARSIHPDMIIMDISMPELSGIKAAKEIWAETPSRKILFWSQFHREAYVRELGKIVPDDAIHGYALKSENDEKLSYAISSILLHDNPYIDPVVRNVQARVMSREDGLSDVEYETLLDVAVGLTDKAIAARRHISVRGVQNRLSMLLEKLVKGEDAHLRESADMEIFNPRTRVVFEAVKRGLLDPDEISRLEKDLGEWLEEEYNYEAAAR